jgi:hypothetical protein
MIAADFCLFPKNFSLSLDISIVINTKKITNKIADPTIEKELFNINHLTN